jgi:ABC-type multidrug transport system fused ATPase/permease subunit
MDTMVGEQGVTLSGGQQRATLAQRWWWIRRCSFRRLSSSVDAQTEAEIGLRSILKERPV